MRLDAVYRLGVWLLPLDVVLSLAAVYLALERVNAFPYFTATVLFILFFRNSNPCVESRLS